MKSKIQSSLFALSVGLSAIGMSAAHAQIQFPIEKPNPTIGDVWKYQTTDLWTGKIESTSETELIGVEADRFVTRFKSSQSPEPKTGRATKELKPCNTMRNSDQEICAGSLSFPMQIGKKTEFDKAPYTNGKGYFSGKCEISAEEKVTVPAGTFDTVRIECNGFWTNVFDSNISGKYSQNYWYAPAVNRSIKLEYIEKNPNGSIYNKTKTELTEYISKK